MSAHLDPTDLIDANMDSQRESKLLSMPAEIRRAIYANIIPPQIHAFLSQGRIQLSVCLQPNLRDDHYDGYERRTKGDDFSQGKWARRLRSSWGPHWECEQVAFIENTDMHEHYHNSIHGLHIVCKKMFLDICDFVAKEKVINVTDLATLQALLQTPNELGSAWNLWDYTRPGIQKLNITLRLPIAFYSALEEDEALVSEASYDISIISATYATWASLWPAVCQLQQLRSLDIWLDHHDDSSWSIIKERLALHRIVATLAAHTQARSSDKSLTHIDIKFNLPQLHPGIARPDTHFVQESSPPPFTIERRIRQRYHCEEGATGNLWVRYKADFPIMHELPEYEEYLEFDMNGERNMNREPRMTLQEVEEMEKKLWEGGIDVHQYMQEMIGFTTCF